MTGYRNLFYYNLKGYSVVVGQFSEPYPSEWPPKLKVNVGFIAKLFRELWPTVLNFYSKKKFKTFVRHNVTIK